MRMFAFGSREWRNTPRSPGADPGPARERERREERGEEAARRAPRPEKGLASREGRANGRLRIKPARGRAGKARSTPEQAGTGWGGMPNGGIGIGNSETAKGTVQRPNGSNEEAKKERGTRTRP